MQSTAKQTRLIFSILHYVQSGQVGVLLQSYAQPSIPIYAIYLHAGKSTPKIRAFLDFLKSIHSA